MQFKITFQVLYPGQMLPLSYQYELSAWIYKLIGSSNSKFGDFLHNKGYVSGKKRFKLFTFSNLFVPPPYEIQGDRMKIFSHDISFVISFFVEQAAREMILALFTEQELQLGDRISQVCLKVQKVNELQPLNIIGSKARLRTTSPVLVSQPVETQNGRLSHDYLHPQQPEYAFFFLKNLHDKYKAAQQQGWLPPVAEGPKPQFRVLSKQPKKRGILIKAHTPAETKLIAYNYEFELIAPSNMIRLGILAGFGGENAVGFGASRLLN